MEDAIDDGKIDFSKVIDSSVVTYGGYEAITDETQNIDPGPFGADRTVAEPVTNTQAQQAHAAQTAASPPKASRTTAKAAPKTAPPKPVEEDLPAYMNEEPPPAETTPVPTTQEPGPKVVWYHLATDEGEMVTDAATTDPVVFAQRLVAMVEDCEANGESADGIIAANQETIDDAIAVSPEAAAILQALVGPPAATAPDRWFVPMPMTPKGTQHLGGYVQAVRLMLGSVTSNNDLEAVITANSPTIEGLPPASRDVIWTAVSDVRVRFEARTIADEIDTEIAAGASPAEPPPTEAEPPKPQPDRDAVWTDMLVDDINAATTGKQLADATGGTAVTTKGDRLKRERPELYEKIETAYKAKQAELKR
jgi:hypothetical protein